MNKWISVMMLLLLSSTRGFCADIGLGVAVKNNENSLYIPVRFSDAYFWEVKLQMNQYKDQEEYGYEFKSRELGFGGFKRQSLTAEVELYWGARLSYVDNHSESGDFYVREADGYRIAPTLGFEYSIADKFYVAAEAEWFYYHLDGDFKQSGGTSDIDLRGSGTDARVLLRFYF